MALPPKDDPRRPLYLAARSMVTLGILFSAIAGLTLLGFAVGLPRIPTAQRAAILVAFMTVLLVLVIGITYIVLGIFLRRHQGWAVTMAIVIVSIHLLLTFISLPAAIVQAIQGSLVLLAVSILFIIALAQLIYLLARSYAGLSWPRFGGASEARGFEPLHPGSPAYSDAPPMVQSPPPHPAPESDA